MGITGFWQWVVVLAIVLLLFGANRIPRLMGDVAKGVNAFKKGLKDDEGATDGSADAESRKTLADQSTADQTDSTTTQDQASANKNNA